MHWVIQENLYNEEGYGALLRALEALGLPYSCHKVIPFSHELLPDVHPTGPVIVCGAHTMIGIAQERGWLPGAYVNENLDFTRQLPHWGERMFNADAHVWSLQDVPFQEKPFFIRPTYDSKHFSGTVMDWETFSTWRDGLDQDMTVTGDTQVMVCPKKVIYAEYRTWIVDGRVVTASSYRFGGQTVYSSELVPEDVVAFANQCAQIWSPVSAYVLDVADTPEGLKILEINCINAAGFYAGNVGKIVEALESL